MTSVSYQLSDYDRNRSIESYRKHVPPELKTMKIWMLCIQRQPLLSFAGDNIKNLMDFEEAISKLLDDRWLNKRRTHQSIKNPKIVTGIPHLAIIFTHTNYCYVDPDHRRFYDASTTVNHRNVVQYNDSKDKKNAFDDDQIEAMAMIRDYCPGWRSWSGDGLHGLMLRSEKTRHINSDKVNTLVNVTEVKYLAPYELKYNTCFLPPYLEPINDIQKIPPALPQTEKFCEAVNDYTFNNARSPSPKKIPDPDKVELPLEQALKMKQAQKTDSATREQTIETLLDQYRYISLHAIRFIPNGHAEYGGWHRRLTTIGVPKDKIKEIAKSQPGYDDRDDADIDNSKPYDDIEKQIRIEFNRVKGIFDRYKHISLDEFRKWLADGKPVDVAKTIKNNENVTADTDTTPQITSNNNEILDTDPTPQITKNNNDVLKTEPVIYTRAGFDKLKAIDTSSKFFVPRKVNAVFGDAGVGKTGLFLDWAVNELNKGKKVTIISTDMSIEEFRPFLYGYDAKDNRLAIFDETKMVLIRDLIDHIKTFKPDIIIVDTFDSWLEQCSDAFMPEGVAFDVKVASHWVRARQWLMLIISHFNIALLAIFHVPAKSNPFMLPHSSKLKGLLFRTWLVVSKECEQLGRWGQEDIARALKQEPDGTICLYPDKQQCGDLKDKIPVFLNFNVDIDTDKLHEDDQFIPCGVSEPREVQRNLSSTDADKTALSNKELTVDEFVDWLKKQMSDDKTTVAKSVVDKVFGKNPSFGQMINQAIREGKVIYEGYGRRNQLDGTFCKYRYSLPDESVE